MSKELTARVDALEKKLRAAQDTAEAFHADKDARIDALEQTTAELRARLDALTSTPAQPEQAPDEPPPPEAAADDTDEHEVETKVDNTVKPERGSKRKH